MIDINILNILGVSILGTMTAFWYSPIQGAKDRLLTFLPFSSLTTEVFNCSKCSSFILGLIFFWNIFAAGLCALVGFIIQFIIHYIEYWYESN